MLSFGICIGALSLHLGMVAFGHPRPQFGDFTLAFAVVTAISASATIWHLRFSPTAGEELTGRRTS
jgi:hypothetical protein